jgi:acyl-CoA reductase-like NAD-dependent aldehyde dehydrogenase
VIRKRLDQLRAAIYVLSSDIDHAKRMAGQLQAGRVVVNAAPYEPLAPFGGLKQSGIGRAACLPNV